MLYEKGRHWTRTLSVALSGSLESSLIRHYDYVPIGMHYGSSVSGTFHLGFTLNMEKSKSDITSKQLEFVQFYTQPLEPLRY